MICAESSYAPCRRIGRNVARRHTTELTADNRGETIETTIPNPNTEVTTEETKVVAYERQLVAENAVTEVKRPTRWRTEKCIGPKKD